MRRYMAPISSRTLKCDRQGVGRAQILPFNKRSRFQPVVGLCKQRQSGNVRVAGGMTADVTLMSATSPGRIVSSESRTVSEPASMTVAR
jgi:hypothetical protein